MGKLWIQNLIFHSVHMDLGGGGVKSLIHFHCVLHAEKGGGESIQIACKVVYILNGWPNGWHTVANLREIWTHIAHRLMAPSQNYKRESFSVTVK